VTVLEKEGDEPAPAGMTPGMLAQLKPALPMTRVYELAGIKQPEGVFTNFFVKKEYLIFNH
jgi:hypothetical protein